MRKKNRMNIWLGMTLVIGICFWVSQKTAFGEGRSEDAGDSSQYHFKTTQEIRELAEQGDASAQWNLGRYYQAGKAVPKDEAEAVKWLRKSADQGHELAQWDLGAMYVEGRGGAVDDQDKEAVKWWHKAAEQGNENSQYWLGRMYEQGQGIPKNDPEAVKWFRKAAEQGNADAQVKLGIRYATGETVSGDYVEAVKWFQKAAKEGKIAEDDFLGWIKGKEKGKFYRLPGHAEAQFYLGIMYAEGQGVPKDDKEAVKWWHKAAEQGDENAQFNLDRIAEDIYEKLSNYLISSNIFPTIKALEAELKNLEEALNEIESDIGYRDDLYWSLGVSQKKILLLMNRHLQDFPENLQQDAAQIIGPEKIVNNITERSEFFLRYIDEELKSED